MEKLRIHFMKYVNRGMADKSLKGQREFHVIFKFDTEEKAKKFTNDVKEWYYSLEQVKGKVIKALSNDETVEKPSEEKTKRGRPVKEDIQG